MRVIIAAAGTGGHINPGIAIANKIKEMEQDSEILFIGTGRGLEKDLVPRAGYELKNIRAYGMERKITLENIKRLYYTIKAVGDAKRIISNFKPDVVVGTGGYICMPVMLAAKKLKIPTVLHESNAFPGVSIKVLSKKVDKVLVGFEDAKERLPKAKCVVVTGNPTKIKAKEYTIYQKQEIIKNMGLDILKPIVLVFGGSQGANSINNSFIEIISKNKNKDYQIIWAAGTAQYDEIAKKLQFLGMDINNIPNAKILPYIYNMEEVMSASDLIVCRSGAMTITEIGIMGKPAIFIPFPHATENHQEYNARVLEKVGAAKIILDRDLSAEILNQKIENIINQKEILKEMGKRANSKAISNVEDRIYNEIKSLKSK